MEAPPNQISLSAVLEDQDQAALYEASPPTNRSRLLAVSAPGAPEWLNVTPSPGLDLRLSPDEAQVLIKWWQGLPLFGDGATCPLCGPQVPLDKLGHHANTCKRGLLVCHRHNILRGVIDEFFRRALLSPELEKVSGADHSHSQTCPADIHVSSWSFGKPDASDITVVNLLNPSLRAQLWVTQQQRRNFSRCLRMAQSAGNLDGSALPWM